MGKKEIKEILRQSDDRKKINPIIAFLAFLLGAVTTFAVFWRMLVSKGKKGAKVSDDAVDRDYEAADREMKHLLRVLQRENERRMWGEPEIRISGDYGVSGANPANVQTQKVQPYKPHKRLTAKKIFTRATAVVAAAAIAMTGFTMLPTDDMASSTALAKESFGGIKQVVEEHGEDNPFVILDIVPGKASVEIGGKTYDFSLGTIGYLAPGQSPIQQDLLRIFKGEDGEDNTDFYDFESRKKLTDLVMKTVSDDITYEEAYEGTGVNLKASVWSQIFDSVEDAGNYPTGRLYASVKVRDDAAAGTDDLPALEGYDYNLTEGSALFAMNVPRADVIYTFAGTQGDCQVIFRNPGMALSGYRAEVMAEGSSVEAFAGSYPETTSVYRVENGVYTYAGVIGNHMGTIGPEDQEKPKDPETPTKPEEPTEPEIPTEPTEPTEPIEPTDPETPPESTEPTEPETPAEPTEPETPAEPTEPETSTGLEPAPESTPAQASEPTAAAFRTQSVLETAGTAGRWYLCVNEGDPEETGGETEGTGEETEGTGEEETGGGEKPGEPNQPDEPGEGENEEYKQPEEEGEPEEPKQPEEIPAPGAEEGNYCIVKFTYVDNVELGVEEFLYQDTEVRDVSSENPPWDSYVAEKGMFSNRLNAEGEADALAEASSADVDGCFEYVGGGKGMYMLTKVKVTDADLQDNEIQDADSQDADAQDRSARAAESSSKPYYVEVWNAPVYMSCSAGNDWLRKYVFNSLTSQDNASDDFTIEVQTVLAGDVTYEMVQEADLVYLEDGKGMSLQDVEGVVKSYVYSEKAEDGLEDVSDNVITTLLYETVQELKPVIVDYGIIESEDYPGSKYQKLAKVFLKKDLTAYYNEMAKSKDLAASALMNVGNFPDKSDNNYHYVNRNVYIASGKDGEPLVANDFPDDIGKDKAKAGFSEVLAAIRAENVILSDDEKISEKISKAMAVQYIINYSLGLVGEYKDLSILELQPTANMESDLHIDPNEDKGSVVLYWQREDRDGEGQQILRSSKMIEIDVATSSVAAFNSSYQDINADYNMIFIGLDGQRLYHDWDKDGVLSAIYNDKDLNGKVYHTGDRVAGSDARYDANDITEQKKEALLDYLRAGYPIVVENECFKDRSARTAKEKDINTKYIDSDSQMYDFLKEAISMGESDDDDENGIGIYTIEDVHSSALFAMQLNAQRPKIELLEAGDDGGQNDDDSEKVASDMIRAETVPEKAGVLRGTIEYRIASDRAGEDKTYKGRLDRHLYLDLNYDGVYAPEEEIFEYQYEETSNGGKVSIDFNEISFGIVPWKLEVTDADIRYRRAETQGCFTISSDDDAKVRVLQVLDDTANNAANFQEQYENIEESMLAHYLRGAEASLNMNWKLETVTPSVLADRLSKNANYLTLWDVVVLGFGESGNPGDTVTTAVNDYITAGGSVLVSSAGASADKGRLGIPAAVLGQKEEQTYGKLGLNSNLQFRYEGILAGMFNKTSDLLVDRINDGTIARWPYEIGDTASLEGTEVSMPDYLLDIGTARDTGQPYATAWFTLIDADYDGGYSVSPRDGQNNYYVYSMGNVVYVGQSEYPYTYDRKTGETPDGTGIDECRILVNALMAAYNAGVHRAQVSIVAGFNGVSKVESVTIPYDVAFKENGDGEKRGILGETVDVYFRFKDNNIACDKTTDLLLYYKNAGAPADASLLLADGGINETDYEYFTSPVWAVENNRLVEVTEGLVPGKVYRIKAPLTALQSGDDETSEICVLLKNRYTRAGQEVEALSMDSVSLNRAQMFLLE